MERVARRAIGAGGGSRANRRAVLSVERIVTLGAEAAESAEPEGGVVAMMGFNVICDRCRRHVAAFQTSPTQGLDPQLVPAAALPASGGGPRMNFATVRHLL
jgi:hypothetical protein